LTSASVGLNWSCAAGNQENNGRNQLDDRGFHAFCSFEIDVMGESRPSGGHCDEDMLLPSSYRGFLKEEDFWKADCPPTNEGNKNK
jgi:hypothetical protein